MDYSQIIVKYVSEALKSEYGLDVGKLVFKHTTRDSINVYYDEELILGFQFNYILGPVNMDDVISLKIENPKNSRVETSINEISKSIEYDKAFEDGIRDTLKYLDLDISRENLINNAQEIMEIAKKAKEKNIKEDINTLEHEILKEAQSGEDSIIFYLNDLKSKLSKEEVKSVIVKHFETKGFKCSIEGSFTGYLKISWGE